jgi:hypothetical protein
MVLKRRVADGKNRCVISSVSKFQIPSSKQIPIADPAKFVIASRNHQIAAATAPQGMGLKSKNGSNRDSRKFLRSCFPY